MEADDGYSFASNVSGYLNGLNASVIAHFNGEIYVSRTFTCPAVLIDSVSVTGVAEPYAGAAPTYSASVPTGKGYQIKTDYWTNGVWWYNNTDDKTMTASDTFVAGKEYNLTVLLKTADNSVSFASYVSGSLNNKSAKVYNYGDGTVAVYLTYTCPGIPIDSVSVTEITAPTSGAYPDKSCKLPSHCGYKTVYYSGDITWYTEEGDILNPDTDKFVDGEKYNAQVELLALDGYEFAESGLTGTINGTSAAVRVLLPKKKLTVSRWFTCSDSIIKKVSVTGITKPVTGMSPSYSAVVSGGNGYQISSTNNIFTKNGIGWFNMTDSTFLFPANNDQFEEGKEYGVFISLETTSSDYQFSDEPSATVNGKPATISAKGKNSITVFYIFNGSYILGDADDNGEIESVDATFVQRYAASIPTPYITQVLMQGDVDGDGNLTVMDATAIQYFLANMKNPHNIGKTL